MKARKKPLIIDYYPIEYSVENGEGLVDWVQSFGDNVLAHFGINESKREIVVKTLEGTSYTITDQDVVIRGVKGEYYPCKKDIFEKTYDLLN